MRFEYESDQDAVTHKLLEKYMRVIKLHHMYLERELNRSGVFRSQHQMLMYISNCPNASQRDIADHQHVSTATVAVSLKKLEKGGYIKRVVDEADNRFNQICITSKGKNVVDGSKQIFKKVEQSSFCDFTEQELVQFEDYLDRLRFNVERLFQEQTCNVTQEEERRG